MPPKLAPLTEALFSDSKRARWKLRRARFFRAASTLPCFLLPANFGSSSVDIPAPKDSLYAYISFSMFPAWSG